MSQDRLEEFGISKLDTQSFDDFWADSESIGKDYRGRELVKQPIRSLDPVCANTEKGYGRGFNKGMPRHLKIARGDARVSKGRYWRMRYLLPLEMVKARRVVLDQIIGGLTATIDTIEKELGR